MQKTIPKIRIRIFKKILQVLFFFLIAFLQRNLIGCKIGKCSGFAVLELVFGPGEQYLEKSSLVGTKSGIFLQCALVRGSCSVVVN